MMLTTKELGPNPPKKKNRFQTWERWGEDKIDVRVHGVKKMEARMTHIKVMEEFGSKSKTGRSKISISPGRQIVKLTFGSHG